MASTLRRQFEAHSRGRGGFGRRVCRHMLGAAVDGRGAGVRGGKGAESQPAPARAEFQVHVEVRQAAHAAHSSVGWSELVTVGGHEGLGVPGPLGGRAATHHT